MGLEYYYMICILLSSLLLFLTVYLMITLSDLESDYINSRDCAAKMNFWTLPRIGLQMLHSIVLVLAWEWKILVLSLPFSSWLIYRKMKQAPGHSGLYDPTDIHNRENLRFNLKECLGYMGYHLFSFFMYMYMIVSTLTGNPENPTVTKEVPW
jgi:hypothetical protein